MNRLTPTSFLQKRYCYPIGLVLALFLNLFCPLSAATSGNFKYTDNGTTITITGYVSSPAGELTIPSTIISKPVTKIGDSAFYNCSSLTSVTIPSSVTSIGSSAFYSCVGLTSIIVDANNTYYSSLDGVLFDKNQTALIQYPPAKVGGSYIIPSGVTSIGFYAFSKCSSLTGVTIPPGVTYIGGNAFSDCANLASITIPPGVTSILEYTFQRCSGLLNVTIPSSVNSIGTYAFAYCSSLVDADIPLGVASIGSSAFEGCSGLTSVSIPNSVTSIESFAFQYCSGLVSVTIPSSVTSIGTCVFYSCGSLETVTIPSSVTSIGNSAFGFCRSLTNLTIPSSVTKIESSAFHNCESLDAVTIPSSVTSIGINAFSYCSGLTSVTIPSSVTSLGFAAFTGCSSLALIAVDPNNTYYSSLDGILFNKNQTTLIQYPPARVGGIYVIPISVTSIESSAFQYCIGLVSVTIPSSVTSIGSGVFTDCSSLASVSIPSSVTSIGANEFSGCSSLTSVVIPTSVTSFGTYAFEGCSSLTNVVIPASVTSIGSGAFLHCSSLTSVFIPSSVTSIRDNAFAGCSSLTNIVIPTSVTSIGSGAFQGCSSLASVTIPTSVTSIGSSVFHYCIGLTSITVDANNAYYSSLDGVLFNKNQTTLIQYPPAKAGSGYSIPPSVTSIGSSAFSSCSSLSGIYFQGNPPSLSGSSVFLNDNNLTIYYLPTTSGWTSTFGDRPTMAYSLALYNFHLSQSLLHDGTQDWITPAGDGVPNIYKYAFNMIGSGPGQATTLAIPNTQHMTPSGTAGLPWADSNGIDETRFEWIYVRRKASTNPGITYLVEFTNDLASPSWAVNPSATESVTSIDADFERVTLTDSVANAAKRFSRVRVTAP